MDKESLVKLDDYTPYPFKIPKIEIDFNVLRKHIIVSSFMQIEPLIKEVDSISLQGIDLELEHLSIDGVSIKRNQFSIDNGNLIINNIPSKKFKLKDIKELGLSKYSYKQYLDFFNSSQFKIDYFITNFSDHPASKVFDILRKIKILEEYSTYNIYCILKK